MAKGYWIASVDVSDLDTYKKYVAANGEVFARYGAKFLVRAGAFETFEGESRSRNVVIEFDTYENALACYRSPEYAAAKAIRVPVAQGDLIIVEGYDGSQPGE